MTNIDWNTTNITWSNNSTNTTWLNDRTYTYTVYPGDSFWHVTENPRYKCPSCKKEYASKPKVCKKCGANDKELI